MRKTTSLALLLVTSSAAATLEAPPPNVAEIVQRSSAAMAANWKAAPQYSYLERDVDTKHGGDKSIKTYRVFVIDGSPYNRLIATGDRPLSKQDDTREEQKLKLEIERRKHESAAARQARVAKYQHERHQDHEMMTEMTRAFTFKYVRSDTLDGHSVWVLDATPKPGYQPRNHEARVLTGMQGRLWIDKRAYQWVKVEAEVTRPVSMFLVAKVGEGTRFVLEQEPVGGSLWLPKHFTVDVNASALGFIDESSTDDESYTHYRPMPTEAQLLAARN